VASWTASPSDDTWPIDPTAQPIPGTLGFLDGQTIRDVITPHLGGSQLRIRLSNRFSASPTTFGHVTVGVQAGGPQVSSTVDVTFAGSTSVTVPAGADAMSDPVALPVSAFTPLAVSIYVPGVQGSVTKHWNANATSYATSPFSGDAAARTSGGGFSSTTHSWLYLDGLDVAASSPTRAVVTLGDSITDGFVGGSPVSLPESTIPNDVNGRYPDDLQRRLSGAGIPISIVNAGISSNELLGSSSFAGPSGLSRLRLDALSQSGASGVLLQEGINDLGLGGATAAQLEAGYTQAINQVHAAGMKIWLGTILPAANALVDGVLIAPKSDTYRQAINVWIRTQTLADGVVDFDAALRDPAHPSDLAPQYASVDNLHPNLAGYQAMANAVPLSIFGWSGQQRARH
jgi:lysophospholipase L1-like esterase